MAYGVIYKITNKLNGMPYIGQTTRTIAERFKEHTQAPTYIGNAMRKYGMENFTIEIIAECANQEELNAQEIRFIAEYDSMAPKGYNRTEGGEGGIPCEETKARLRESALAFYDEHPERRDEISEEQKARFSDPEERKKAAERTRKSFEDPERMAKHVEGQKKRFERQEERDKIAVAVTERFSKPGEREAQSERIKKSFENPEVKADISKRQKKRFEDPNERKKVADGVNRYYAEHGGREQSAETREKIRIKRKAYCAKVRAAKQLTATTEENQAAADWKTPLSELKISLDEKTIIRHSVKDKNRIISDEERAKRAANMKKVNAKRRVKNTIAAENRAAAESVKTLNINLLK